MATVSVELFDYGDSPGSDRRFHTLLRLGRSGRKRWSWRFGITNALAILSLPIVLMLTMNTQYFTAVPFMIASILITLVGVSMWLPLWWVRAELTEDSGR